MKRASWVACFVLIATPVIAKVSYRTEDLATVRVFAVAGIDDVEFKNKQGAPVHVAVVRGGHGSGVVLTKGGLIVTAQHVIDDATVVAVSVPGRPSPQLARVLFQSRRSDIAFLQVDGEAEHTIGLPPEDPALTVRQQLFALGYPLDGTRTEAQSTAGVLASELPDGRLQLDMAVNPGNSGGPVIDEKGTLVGLITQGADPKQGAQGIAIAVPVAAVQRLYAAYSSRAKSAPSTNQSTPAHQASGRVVSALASVSSLETAVDYIEHTDPALSAAIQLAASAADTSADILALLSAHYYNEAIVRRHLDGRHWEKPFARAKALAKQAIAKDPDVAERNRFLRRFSDTKTASKSTSAEPPKRVMGLRLNAPVGDLENLCRAEELTFEKTAKGFRCSEPPDSDAMTGPVDIRTCGTDRACRIDVIHRPSKALNKVWVEAYHSWNRRMRSKYGEPQSQVTRIPFECKENLRDCLENGTALLSSTWQWEGQRLILGLGRLDGQATLRLSLISDTAKASEAPTEPTGVAR